MRATLTTTAMLTLAVCAACPAVNLALDENCRLKTDSDYSGYSPAVLNDGIQIVAGDDWTLAGWASAESPGEHYIELSWPEPRDIREVAIYWANDFGVYRSSARYLIQTRLGDDWATVCEGANDKPVPFSAHVYGSSEKTKRIRILQPAACGPAGRENLMWVAEVAAYGPGAGANPDLIFREVETPLGPGSYDVTFLTRAQQPGRCEITLAGEKIGAVHSRDRQWTQHHLVVDVSKKSDLVIAGSGGVEVAQVKSERRKGPGGAPVAPINQLKNMHLETPLADAVIAVPAGDEFAPLAAQVQAKVKAVSGLELPIRPAAEVAENDLDKRTIVAIGNALNNPVIETLYNKGFVYADSVYPGEGGYAVRTVHDPLGAGFNVVTASGSDIEGAKLAVEKLCEHLDNAGGEKLPRILDIKLGPPQSKGSPPTKDSIEGRVKAYLRLRESGDAPEWALNNFAPYGLRYNTTGDLGWAEMYRALMLALIGFWDERGPWPMEWLWDPYWAWDNCEEAPCFTDEDRLKITNFLLDLGRTDRTRYAGAFTARNEISGGHQLDQNLCMFCLGDYFWKYYEHPEAREWLDAIVWRFETSAKYHRLAHDSNDYNHAGYWFLLRHARISDNWAHVTNGEFGRFVMYTQMMLDNLGYRAQNGDSGSPFAGPQPDMYSMASWLYKDGKYKWAIRNRSYTTAGNYANDIEPVKPEELLGVCRFDIEPVYYKYLTGHEADSELPPNVAAISEAYDKISLRADFDPRAEYMILDGMSRGEHGHDDGNSIIRYTDKGRIWLVDDDYIRRAPKWHNSAVVIKDGEGKLQPPLARADHLKDFGPVALIRSTMTHYTGTDWERNIIWVKNKYFVFIDNFVAQEPADYRLKMIWRTLGETSVKDGDFEVRQAGKREPFAAFKPDQDSDGNGIPDGFTASMTNKWGEVKTRSALDKEVLHSAPASIRMEADPNGYAVIYAYWPVTGGEKYRFHTMCKVDTAPGCTASTTVYWTGAGRHRLPQVKGGGPASGTADWAPMDIEDLAPKDAETAQVVIRISSQGSETGSGKAWFDDLSLIHIAADGAETTVFPSPPGPPSYSYFHIKNADGARLHVSSFLQRGHPRKDGYFVGYQFAGPAVKTLQQINDRSLDAGQNCAFLNLLYTSDEQTPQDFDIVYINPTTAVIDGDGQPVLVGVRPAGQSEYQALNLTLDADMFCVRGRTLYAAGLKRAVIFGKEVFASKEPAEKELKLPSNALPPDLLTMGPRRAMAPVFERQGLERIRQLKLQGAVRTIHRADVNGDAQEETILGDASCAVTVVTDESRVLWQAQTGGPVNVVRAADMNGDGKMQVAAGGDDQKVRLYDSAGKELWAHEFEDYHGRDGKIVAMEIGNLAADGNMKIVVGTEAWHWYALDKDGNQLWRSGIPHAATVCALCDIDGDGDLEIVTGNEYYGGGVTYSHLGKQLWRPGGGPGTLALCAADLDGDGKLECLFGQGDGGASLRCLDSNGKQRWSRSLGDEPRAIVCVDLDGDGHKEVVASSDSMCLYAFKADGAPLWRIDMGDIIGVLAVQGNQVVAGSEDGTVHVIDAGGNALARYPCGSAVRSLTTTEREIIVGLANGDVLWLRGQPPAP